MDSDMKEKSPNFSTGDLVVFYLTVANWVVRVSESIAEAVIAASVSSIQLVEKRSPRQEPMFVPLT